MSSLALAVYRDVTHATRARKQHVTDVAGPAVEAAGLMKTFDSKGENVEAVRGVDLRVEAGEVFGFLGPNGAGKSTTVRMLTTLLSITGGSARVAGVDVAADPDGVRRRIGVALQEAGLDPRQTGRELLELQGRLFALSPEGGRRPRRRAARARRAAGRGRPPHQGLLGRHEAPARPRLGARAPARRAVPRRADDGPGPGEPADRVGRGPAHQRAGHDRLPHHAVPRGGRPALRPAGDHRRRQDRPRGHAAASSRPTCASASGSTAEPTLDDVFLDATGRTRDRIEGAVQEVGA